MVVADAFSHSTQEAEAGRDLYEFEVSLVYRVGLRTARDTQRNTLLKTNTNKRGFYNLNSPSDPVSR